MALIVPEGYSAKAGRSRRNRISCLVLNLAAVLGGMLVVGTASADYVATPKATTWSATDGPVYAIERIGNTIYIGGGFRTLRSPDGTQTVTRNRLAAFDATTGNLLPWNPGANNIVRVLRQSSDGTALFAGGFFGTIGGVSHRGGFGKLDAVTGALIKSFNPQVVGNVYAIERSGTTIFIGGEFTTVSGQSHQNLAAMDETTGVLVSGWDGSADNTVRTLLAAQDGTGRLFVGGLFRNLSGQARDFSGALNSTDGSINSSWQPGSACTDLDNQCYVLDMVQDNSKVYASVAGPGGRVIAWNLSNAAKQWVSYGDGNTVTLALRNGVIYAGGHFGPNWGNQVRSGFVALSAATGGVLSYAPLFYGGDQVFDILADVDTLRIVGGYTRVNSDNSKKGYAEFAATASVSDITPPSTPTNLRATKLSDTLATFYWNNSTDDLSGVSGYKLVRDGLDLVTTNVTNYTDRDLLPSTTHTYQVQAVDAAGNWSPLSPQLTITTQAPSQALVRVSSEWKYWSNGGDPGTIWMQPNFNDSKWSLGVAELGYGESDESTLISPKGVASYFRRNFDVADPSVVKDLTLRLLRDDGAVVYLNGIEVCRSNMPATAITYQTFATLEVKGPEEQKFFEQSVPVGLLVQGTNTLAVEVHQHTANKPMDLSFDLELVPTF